jgi:hypothetical protein
MPNRHHHHYAMIGEILEAIGLLLSFPSDPNRPESSKSLNIVFAISILISIPLSIFLIQKVTVTEDFSPIIISALISLLLSFVTVKILQRRNSLSQIRLSTFLWIAYATFLIYLFAGFFVFDFIQYAR